MQAVRHVFNDWDWELGTGNGLSQTKLVDLQFRIDALSKSHNKKLLF